MSVYSVEAYVCVHEHRKGVKEVTSNRPCWPPQGAGRDTRDAQLSLVYLCFVGHALLLDFF